MTTRPPGADHGAALDTLQLQRLTEAVQANCHVSDARHAGDMTMCIYLLQMREFFRWEKGFTALQSLPGEALGAWLSEREALWGVLEEQGFRPLPIDDRQVDPFDVAAINARLNPAGLVYGAGFLAPGRASFFLGALESAGARGGAQLLTSGREHARGVHAVPAALSNGTIFLRREALSRWLWQKYEAWTLRRPPGAFRALLWHYGFEQIGAPAVDRIAAEQGESLVLHELGELAAGSLLGARWQDMRANLSCRSTDLHLRALRDHLADCLVTLPALLHSSAPASIHFWFSNLEGLRAELFPRAARAYTAWCDGDQGQALLEAVAAGRTHWPAVCEEVLGLYATHGEEAPMHIRRFLGAARARL